MPKRSLLPRLVAVLLAIGAGVALVYWVMDGRHGEESAGGPSPQIVSPNLPSFVEMAKQLTPSVVNISTTAITVPRRPQVPGVPPGHPEIFDEFFERFFGTPAPRRERSLGSGFFISKDGLILTNNHVVAGADEVKVRLSDGREFGAKIQGLDPKLDVALLKIDSGEDLPVAPLGDSAALAVGEWVLAIGNPFGLEQTVTAGIVSAKERVIGAGPYDDFIQTDASINPGNSGGPLFNTRGEVVGINTAIIAGGQGIGFATPIDLVEAVLPQLKETGHVVRGWIGVAVQELTPELARSFGLQEADGALVSEVVPNSPAAAAGIRRGDVILSFGGRRIENVDDLPRMVASIAVGEKVAVEILREGKKIQVPVTVAKLEDAASRQIAPEGGEALGLTVTDVTPEAAHFYGLQRQTGALVTAVDPAGAASAAAIQPGDIIVEVNDIETPNSAAFANALSRTKKGDLLRFLVQRGSNIFFTTLKRS